MAATIHDVAKKAGVSVATVSRFINASGKLADGTALKVRHAIHELGFVPNAMGRNLSTAKSRMIAVVIPSLSNPVFAEAVEGISEIARKDGYTLMFTATEYNADDEKTVINPLLGYRPEGVILTVNNPVHSEVLDILERSAIPAVLIYNQASQKQVPTVTVDNVQAGIDVANRLLAQGHVHMAMIAGSLANSDRAQARWQGFSKRVQDQTGKVPHLIEVDFVAPDLEGVVETLMSSKPTTPSALFCSNDLLALRMINCLIQKGLHVPQDISVVGFDGIRDSALLNPVLETVVQPSKDMGRKAADLLLSLIKGEKVSCTNVLPHHLRLGETTGTACKHALSSSKNLSKPVKGTST